LTVRSLTPLRRISSINVSGMPQRPKPPAAIVIPSHSRPARPSRDVSSHFFAMAPTSHAAETVHSLDLHARHGHAAVGIGVQDADRAFEVVQASHTAPRG